MAVAISLGFGCHLGFNGNWVAQLSCGTPVTDPSSDPVVGLSSMTTPLPSCAVARLFGTTYNYYRSEIEGISSSIVERDNQTTQLSFRGTRQLDTPTTLHVRAIG